MLLLKKPGKLGQLLLFIYAILLSVIIHITQIYIGVDYLFSLFLIIPVFLVSWYCSRNLSLSLVVVFTTRWFYWLFNPEYTNVSAIRWNALSELLLLLLISQIIRLLRKYLEQTYSISNTDHLTGLLNLRGITLSSEPVLALSKREQHWNSLVYFDIDDFKQVNDNYGHEMGDNILAMVGKYLKTKLRHSDISARVGGDEFVVLMPSTNAEESKSLIKKINKEMVNAVKEKSLSCSFSYGIVTWRDTDSSFDGMVRKADELMYRVKRKGKANIAQKTYSDYVEPKTEQEMA